MRIRRATGADGPGIAAVHVASWQAAYRELLPADFLAGLDATIERRKAAWAASVTNPALDVFVADDGDTVGFSSVSASRDDDLADHGELQTIYALERVWGRGVGHALHEAAMQGLIDRGFELALLWVLDGNDRTIRWYERQGWAIDGASKDDTWGDLVLHEIRMVRSL